jgi:hypothetical protein
MYRSAITTLLCIYCAVFSTYGDRVIEEWGGATSGFTISNYYGTVEITAPGTYYIKSYDGATPANINWIHVQSGVGNVEVHVYWEDPYGNVLPGAYDLKEINLAATGVTGTIGKVVLANDLAEDGPVLATTLAGPVQVTGEILDDITIVVLSGDIACVNMQNLSMTGAAGTPPPNITIAGTYRHRNQPDGVIRHNSGIYPYTSA